MFSSNINRSTQQTAVNASIETFPRADASGQGTLYYRHVNLDDRYPHQLVGEQKPARKQIGDSSEGSNSLRESNVLMESAVSEVERREANSDSSYEEIDLDHLIFGARTKSCDSRKNAKRLTKKRKASF